MALALDASTPARKTNGNTTITSASFSPPADSLLFALVIADENNTFPSCTGGGLTWTKVEQHSGSGTASLALWWAHAATAPGSMTVTATRTGDWSALALQVLVFTGAETSFTGATNYNAQTANSGSLGTFTATADGSWAWAVYGNDQGGTNDVLATGCSWYPDGMFTFQGISGAVIERTTADGVSGASTSVGTTLGAVTSILAFEVKPAAGGGEPQTGSGTVTLPVDMDSSVSASRETTDVSTLPVETTMTVSAGPRTSSGVVSLPLDLSMGASGSPSEMDAGTASTFVVVGLDVSGSHDSAGSSDFGLELLLTASGVVHLPSSVFWFQTGGSADAPMFGGTARY